LGLVEVTRKRMRPSLVSSYSEPCPHCNGTGKNMSRDAVVMRIHRWLSRAEYFIGNSNLRVTVHPNVRKFLLDHPDYMISFRNRVEFTTDENIKPDLFKVFLQGEEKEITNKYNP
jgi:ribonuclease G